MTTMRRLAILPALALVAACGFTPVYGSGGTTVDGDPSAVRQQNALLTQAVTVAPIADRIGQRVRQELQRRLTPRGQVVPPRYRLDMRLDEAESLIAIGRDTAATRSRYQITAQYAMVDLATGAPILSSSARSSASYNIPTTTAGAYAVVAARNDARRRAAIALGEEINRRLTIFFATGGAGAGTPDEDADPAPLAPPPTGRPADGRESLPNF